MNSILQTFKEASLSFLFSSKTKTSNGTHIRDSIDLKRIMILVVIALIPSTIVAILNTGLQSFVYTNSDPILLSEYFTASNSTYALLLFIGKHFGPIISKGALLFLPILFISYAVGGFWEILFAAVRKTEVSEGFLVTGILFALTLPPTLPFWMIIVSVSMGIILGKELFGGTGMNILNPALICRCIIYFAFPSYMSGDIWVGSSTLLTQESLIQINQQHRKNSYDSYTTASSLSFVNAPQSLKRIHVDAIALAFQKDVPLKPILEKKLYAYNKNLNINQLSSEELSLFITDPKGLGLSPDYLSNAYRLSQLKYNQSIWSNSNLILGNQIGSMGETSTLACLLGAIFLLVVGIASYHTMASVLLGALFTAFLFQFGSQFGIELGAYNQASYDLPFYKHLLLGGLAFGLVFMATDPVSSPTLNSAKWAYGLLIGSLAIIIRLVNPAFPEGVMLAILFGNVFAPLFDRCALSFRKKGIHGTVRK